MALNNNAININAGFEVGSQQPLDSRQWLSTVEMKNADVNIMPDPYFAINKEDHFLYIFSKTNPISESTGYFTKYTNDGGMTVWKGSEAERDALPEETRADESIIFYTWDTASAEYKNVVSKTVGTVENMSEADYQALETKDARTIYTTETGVRVGENYVATNNTGLVKDKTVLFIGDSYGDSSAVANPWPQLVISSLTFKQVYTLCTGGHGFTGKEGATQGTTGVTMQWKTDLTNFVNAHTTEELASINDVYIIGGFNDIYSTYETIKSYMSEFFEYAHTNIPNAEFHLGMSGWCNGTGAIVTPNVSESQAQIKQRLWNVIHAYSECPEYNCNYIGDLYLALHNYGVDFDNSHYHPSAIGARKLANCISSYIVGKTFTIDEYEIPEIFTVIQSDGEGGTTESEQIVFYASQSNHTISGTNFGNSTSSGATRFTFTPVNSITALDIINLSGINFTDKIMQLKSGLVTGKAGNGSWSFPATLVINDTVERAFVFISGSGFLSIIPEINLMAGVPVEVIIRPFTILAKIC